MMGRGVPKVTQEEKKRKKEPFLVTHDKSWSRNMTLGQGISQKMENFLILPKIFKCR